MTNLYIITAPCWNCDKEMRVALVGNKSGDLDYGPERFSNSEKKLAEENGVLLKIVRSKIAKETYLANVCAECGQFVGKWFFFAKYLTQALYGNYKYKLVELK